MTITVRLFATFRENREKESEQTVPEGCTVSEIVSLMGIAESDVAIIMVNGRSREMDWKLSEGDTLALFPPVGGG